MKMFIMGACALSLSGAATVVHAAPAPTASLDVPTILKQMTGCFRVTFNYVEDGDHDAFYEPVYERAALISESPLTIERTLIVEGRSQKHWSETWVPVQGATWRQEVTGPYGDFRYGCEGEWLLNQWSCTAEHAPKPRRDAQRPYQDLTRRNTLQINARRWVHVQANTKWTESGDVYATESGWNIYEKVASEPCN